MQEPKHIGQLNPQTFYCSCGIFPASESGLCDHWPDVIERPEPKASQMRHIAILTALALIAVGVLAFGLIEAAK